MHRNLTKSHYFTDNFIRSRHIKFSSFCETHSFRTPELNPAYPCRFIAHYLWKLIFTRGTPINIRGWSRRGSLGASNFVIPRANSLIPVPLFSVNSIAGVTSVSLINKLSETNSEETQTIGEDCFQGGSRNLLVGRGWKNTQYKVNRM